MQESEVDRSSLDQSRYGNLKVGMGKKDATDVLGPVVETRVSNDERYIYLKYLDGYVLLDKGTENVVYWRVFKGHY